MKIAWLFPGQGSQSVGMGREVYDASPAAKAIVDHVDAAISSDLGRSLRDLCFSGPEQDLQLTQFTQPAILSISISLLAALNERVADLPAPFCAAGHSLGEYSALVAAGALEVAEACKIVHQRGRAMQDAVPAGVGAMVAVMALDATQIREICDEASAFGVVSPANFNGPGQIVLAGEKQAIEKAAALVDSKKGKAKILAVSAPFHCDLMASAAPIVDAALRAASLRLPHFPVYANVDASPKTDAESIRKALVAQVASSVQWQQTIENMAADGVTHVLEIGPKPAGPSKIGVLAGLVKRISKDIKFHTVFDLASIDLVPSFLAN